jgi:Tfp pilus assembly protein PilO
MPRNFSLPVKFKLPFTIPFRVKDPRVAARVILGVLLVANLAAAVIVFRPFGGSAEDLEREQRQLRQQLDQAQKRLDQSRKLVAKVDQARKEGDQFLEKYVTDRRVTMSTVDEELARIAKESGMTQKGDTKNLEPIDGSDTIQQLTISEIYEGEYASVAKLVNLLDKSQRFLIVSNMVATPKSNSKLLTVTLRLDTFVHVEPGSES